MRSFSAVFFALIALLSLTLLGGVFVGAYELAPAELWLALTGQSTDLQQFLVWQVRIPRLLLALLVGAALATTGAATQGLFRNPLAEPTLIGVTSGAMLFAAAAMVLSFRFLAAAPAWLQQGAVSVAAFCGALVTTGLVYRLASGRGRVNVATMLLAGIAIAALTSAGTGLLIYQSSEQQLRDLTFWTLGSLGGARWGQVLGAGPIILAGVYFLHRDALALNAFLLGEREAAQLGFRVQRVKRRVIIWTALVVGTCISLTGIIGFVGLVIPHLLRIWQGTDYRRLLLFSALLGGSFLLVADTLARTIVAPAELPIGILTALVGAPFFLWLLLRERGKNALL
ncbi:iron ABC transporter permease [Neolewinella lacunae]|uniref:Iron ABC transporter permease n=1 Tax=Neolewinella lacunae TaxID=1517758 RepID=A0A923PKQ1_9BACT|nr:iron ABC transporter permease [Neolewinella lacunae]MBC6992988.1 iron ABC transporter permease [Neolewinella lacunae]MDN3635778.1 iron ABC transporter permease [Neolewinella lacunae]